MTLILRIPGASFTDDTLPVLRRDSIAERGTKFIYDFASPYSWPSQQAPIGSGEVVNNLVNGAASAAIYLANGATLGFSGGGLVFDVRADEGVAIPDSVGMLPANNNGFLYSIWLKHGKQTNKTSQMLVAGNTYQTSAENQYACAYVGDTGAYRMYASGARNGDITGVLEGQVVQLAVAYLPDGAGGHKLRLYKNGAPLLSDVAATGPLKVPVNAARTNSIRRGPSGAGGFVQEWCGSVFRNWLEDLALSEPNPDARAAYADAQVAKDYANNLGRFS
ncbi:hypothetical protein [Pseudomonas helleri]|jgi:hypothetical protein|uniref:hypothetical protein n=1 Tax=Pseudomonas helleri TaxID=1608996 RepID=UPI002F35C2A7